ncbi:30S ribosomal protein S5 [Mesoaciditoga lauensis]|uniref:30S ribosomal protein S5 n=1 Tax=Mesoaciditoga lauensis TaxID=1495039 RepID=UPI00055F5EE4|nr:30S ribosomal protein S5 [Mesoaciditoga lauensis]
MPENRNFNKPDQKKNFRKQSRQPQVQDEFEESVVEIRRVVKVVKGGKNLSFRAIVVVGNRKGKVGLGVASAREVVPAIRKASNLARRNLIDVSVLNDTIPHEILVKYDAAKMLIKPAAPGTGIISSTTVRPAFEFAGIKNVLCKSLGSANSLTMLRAVFKAFEEIKPPEYYAKLRGISLKQLFHGDVVEGAEKE